MSATIIKIVPATDFDQHEPITQFFKVAGLQTLQDYFCQKTGVASLIMYPKGIAITKPSNFSRLCQLIRKTEKGLVNCTKSDVIIGNSMVAGATIQPCKSGGLWDSGVRIHIGQIHIANWLIGQVMNEEQATKIDRMMYYAREIEANIDDFSAAIAQVTVMDEDKFTALSNALYIFALQLGHFAEYGESDHLATNYMKLKEIIDKQPNTKVLYEVWDRMVAEFEQGNLCA